MKALHRRSQSLSDVSSSFGEQFSALLALGGPFGTALAAADPYVDANGHLVNGGGYAEPIR
jgi:hypothetical protein